MSLDHIFTGYENNVEYEYAAFTDIDLDYDAVQDTHDLWDKIRPLYMELHAFVRKVLRDKYGSEIVSDNGPIPSHLLGDTYARNWTKVISYGKPYPDAEEIDYTQALIDKGYTVEEMVRESEKFYTSMNMSAMPLDFWENSEFTEPTDGRIVDCTPTAWQFYDGESVRLAGCFDVNFNDFVRIHGLMGFDELYIAYEDQPYLFHEDAIPGFSESIGDAIKLSVGTRKHLAKIGLIEDATISHETLINYLYSQALDLLAFLPYGLLLETFRNNIYEGNTGPEDLNCHYNYLRDTLQGLEPPGPRDETQFDAGAKFQIANDELYIGYYYTNIMLFQFYESLCITAGEYDPSDTSGILANCDVYGSAAAGNKYTEMLKLGFSKPWPDVIEALTGQRSILADPLLKFFEPLYKFLRTANANNGETVGWNRSTVEYCTAEQLNRLQESVNLCFFERFQGIACG